MGAPYIYDISRLRVKDILCKNAPNGTLQDVLLLFISVQYSTR